MGTSVFEPEAEVKITVSGGPYSLTQVVEALVSFGIDRNAVVIN